MEGFKLPVNSGSGISGWNSSTMVIEIPLKFAHRVYKFQQKKWNFRKMPWKVPENALESSTINGWKVPESGNMWNYLELQTVEVCGIAVIVQSHSVDLCNRLQIMMSHNECCKTTQPIELNSYRYYSG